MPLTIPGLPDAPLTARVNGGPSSVEFFDFFLLDNAGQPAQNFDLFFQWDVTGGSVDLQGGNTPGVFGAPPEQPDGRLVDLGGSTGDPGRFETRLDFQVVAGQTYNITFDFRSVDGKRASATVFVGDLSYTVSTTAQDTQRFSRDFVATETERVRIAFQGDERDRDGAGLGIDGVLFGTVAAPGADEVLVATPQPNMLNGRDGNDLLIGNIFADELTGGAGNDTLNGGAGDDLLVGGAGNDLLVGGVGADAYLFARDLARGRDAIIGFGDDDFIVTTSAFRDGNRDGVIEASRNGRFDFTQGGSVAVTGDDGQAVTQLRPEGSFLVGKQRYYVYSETGTNGLDDVTEQVIDYLLI